MMHDRLVNVPADDGLDCDAGELVVPGDPAKSYLMKKLLGVGMCRGTQRMPLADPLTGSQIQIFADWICSGAPNN
jgi:hypothetical protein